MGTERAVGRATCVLAMLVMVACTDVESRDESETGTVRAELSQGQPPMHAAQVVVVFPAMPLDNPPGPGVEFRALGVHVAPGWILTAASAFETIEFPPASDLVVQFGPNGMTDFVLASPSSVRFHPGAWIDGPKLVWDDVRPESSAVPFFDLALIKTPSINTPIARLWRPASSFQAAAQLLALQPSVSVSGMDSSTNVFLFPPGRSGQQSITGAIDPGLPGLLTGNNQPSALEGLFAPGGGEASVVSRDIGSAAVLDALPNGFPESVAFPRPCTPPLANPGTSAAIGLSTGLPLALLLQNPGFLVVEATSRFVPLFRKQNVDWILNTIADGDDADGDGVCRPKDNCPDADNIHQRNCNLTSEIGNPVKLGNIVAPVSESTAGNACDPVICAETTLQSATIDECKQPLCPGVPVDDPCPQAGGNVLPGDPNFCQNLINAWYVCKTFVRDTFDLRGLRSYPRDASKVGPLTVNDVPTEAWFCQDDPVNDMQCTDDFAIKDARRMDAASAAAETKMDRWHRTSWAFSSGFVTQLIVPDGAAIVDYNQFDIDDPLSGTVIAPSQQAVWDYQSDLSRWLTGDQIIDRCMNADPTIPCPPLVGAMWFHAESNVGQTKTVNGQDVSFDIGSGVAPGKNRDLSNEHVLMSMPGFPYAPEEFLCTACVAIEKPFDPTGMLQASASSKGQGQGQGPSGPPTPGPSEPFQPPHLLWRPIPDAPADAFSRYDATLGEADVILRVRHDIATLAALSGGEITGGCNGELLGNRAGTHVIALMIDPSVVFANAVEPFSYMGEGATFPLAVAMNRTGGSEIVDVVATDGARILASGDRALCLANAESCAACPSGRCDLSGVCCDIPCNTDPDCPNGRCDPAAGVCVFPSAIGSPEAVDYVPVLSRYLGGVFVVGGRNPGNGQPTGEIWFSDVAQPVWAPVPTNGFTPETVLAATYSFRTELLYVLDETAGGQARLVAIDPVSGTVTLLLSTTRHAAWDRHFLALDRDGELLLASSRTSVPPRKHAIARIVVSGSGGPSVAGVDSGNRPLLLAPLVDGAGYTLALEHSPGNDKIIRTRKAGLDLDPSSLAQLGDQL